jgi:endonuclease/exonuclease/phosphatase family metal-dependent hydrolase
MHREIREFKKAFYLILFGLFFISTNLKAQTKNDVTKEGYKITLMTYNLKFASPTYKPLWEVRREMQVDMIRKYNPDIIGTQEGLKEQIDYLAEKLPEYVVIGEGRQGGDDDEHMAIFYKRDKFRLRELNSFALSKTPELIGSGPDVNPRIMTWARLAIINKPENEEKGKYPSDYRGHWENSKEFYIFNTHYFNGGKATLARLNASKLIMAKIKPLDRFGKWTNERPIFLMGDFNCRPGSEPHKVFVGDGSTENTDLFIDTNVNGDPKEIDWILYKGSVIPQNYKEIDYNVNGNYPSDHKPIFVEFLISK